jgi:hypothetical protein
VQGGATDKRNEARGIEQVCAKLKRDEEVVGHDVGRLSRHACVPHERWLRGGEDRTDRRGWGDSGYASKVAGKRGSGARLRELAPTGRSHQAARAREPARRLGELGLKVESRWFAGCIGFSFYSESLIPFSFIFSFEFKPNQATNSNLNISSICIKQRSKFKLSMMQQFISP